MKIDGLKNKILQLAIQGKLVPQDENDEPASVLLEKIREEKEQLIKEKKIKKEKPLPEISDEEKAFDIPEGWEWCRLDDIGTTNIGLTYKPTDIVDKGIAVLRSSNIQNGKMDYDDLVFVKMEVPENKMCKIDDILICARNGSKRLVGKCALINREGMSFGAFMAIFRSQYNRYINIFLNSNLFRSQLGDSNTVTINQITQGMLRSTVCPLPPLSEQKRIVAKVDELFALVDELGENKDAMAKCIADTRNKVLQLAIQGKLVKQDENDEPASVLLEKIRKEKEQLIKEKKIKKEKPLSEISDEEKAFEIAEGWKWCRFGDISQLVGTGMVRSSKEQFTQSEYSYFKMNNIENFTGRCNFDAMTMVNATEDECIKYRLEEGDFLFNTRNSVELVGKTAVVKNIDNRIILFNNNILKINFLGDIVPDYINYFFISKEGRSKLSQYVSSTTNVAAIYQKQLITLEIPLPPLSEQKRIVAKVDEIMNYLDNLEKNLLL